MKRFLKIVDSVELTFRPVECAYVDGYEVGDRVLEGVIFEVRIVNNKFVAAVIPAHASYFKKLNAKMWLKKIEDYCKDLDVFMATPDCDDPDVLWYDDALPLDEHPACLQSTPIILEDPGAPPAP